MHNALYAVFDDDGQPVAGPFTTLFDAEEWLDSYVAYDLLDEEGELVAQGLQFRDGVLPIRIRAAGQFTLQPRPTSGFDIRVRYIGEKDGGDMSDASSSTHGNSSRPALHSIEEEADWPTPQRVDHFHVCTRCGESYLPEVHTEDASSVKGGQRAGRCQDCRALVDRASPDLTEFVERMTRGVVRE